MAYYSSKLWGKKSVLNADAFIAPANFDANAQPLNIITVFGDYANANKAYIFSFTSAIATLILPSTAGITYRWGETISGVDYVYDVVSGTAFTSGSTKRYVIVNSTATSLLANISSSNGINGAVWIYCSSKVYGIYALGNTYLNYVHCENLNSITTIGNNAFQNCSKLTGTLTIPNSVTTIGASAFVACTGLTGTLTIPNSVTTIGADVFSNIPFTYLISNSSYFEVYDEVLYTTTGTITALYSAKGYAGTLTLKSNVTTIGGAAFYNNSLRTGTLTIPNTVTTIGNRAFYGCSNLTGTLTIPNSVTTIQDYAFNSCNKLNGIATIGSGITTIGVASFSYVSLVTEWRILSTVAPAVQLRTWWTYAKPLHVKIGATGYNVAPWTDTTIFSSIIYDL